MAVGSCQQRQIFMQIYVQHGGRQLGPFTEEELKAQLTSGSITPQDYVWWQGQANWVLLSQSQFAPAPVPGMPPPPAMPTPPPPPAADYLGLPRWVIICGCGIASFVGLALVLAFISVVAISVLIALGNQVKGVFTTINSQLETQTNSPDQTDQSSNTAPSPGSNDQSTNAAPAAPAPDSSTNNADSSKPPSGDTNSPPVNQ